MSGQLAPRMYVSSAEVRDFAMEVKASGVAASLLPGPFFFSTSAPTNKVSGGRVLGVATRVSPPPDGRDTRVSG